MACTEPTLLDRSLFVWAVKIAAEIEDESDGTPEDPDALPVLTPNELVARLADQIDWNHLPEDPDVLLKRAGWLLWGEPLGWASAQRLGQRDWQLTISREAWQYAGVEDLDSYWAIRDRRSAELVLTQKPSALGAPDSVSISPPEALAMTSPQSPAPQYQVFVSSTYEDLIKERLAVTQALLKTQRCIPAGMELFSASDSPAWDVIVRALAYTDYLVLIIGNKAGSIVPGEGITYTEKEYQYARNNKIPVLAFLSSSNVLIHPDHQESTEQQAALKAFKDRVKNDGRTVEFWSTSEQLAIQVTGALWKAFADSPRRAGSVAQTLIQARPVRRPQKRLIHFN